MELYLENLIKLALAVFIGGVIGAEREFQDKVAGFRTIILITVGSTLFTIFSISMDPDGSRSRVAANIVTGIGFLGAGAIVRESGRIGGLTTATTIWLSAALGMGVGIGDLYFVLTATLITLLVLLVFPKIGAQIDRIREARTYKIVIRSDDLKKLGGIEQKFQECSIRVFDHHRTKTEKSVLSTWQTIGSPRNHARFVDIMMRDKSVKELDY